MSRVRARMNDRTLTAKDAAALIGIGVATLRDHLAGEHVRSDSARKYENWLAGRCGASNVFALPSAERQPALDLDHPSDAPAPAKPRLVVDIFSGCGGLSLGFDLLDGGRQFRTILALDNQAAPIATLNRNAAALGHGDHPVGRIADLTEFLNGTEFLAFYMDHVADGLGDPTLRADLNALSRRTLPIFLDAVAAIDREFIAKLNRIRSGPSWKVACEGLDRRALGQTSVVHFHDTLRLPRPSLKVTSLPPLLWNAPASERTAERRRCEDTDLEWMAEARVEWEEQAAAFIDRAAAPARGQLSSSSRRLDSFGSFLGSPVMEEVRDAWIDWRARRLSARASTFCAPGFALALQALYEERARVAVLVGGPPCQGFSRIGRGKIRSLRDARVHAQSDKSAGDTRNRLFEQYVTVLGALRPEAFLFENVAHFKSVVNVGEQAFHATELLAEAVDRISDGELSYGVSSDLIDASRHGVPQTRVRYFMAGVRQRDGASAFSDPAATCLRLRRAPDAPLSLALAGLPAPTVVGGDLKARAAMGASLGLAADGGASHPFTAWIRQPLPIGGQIPSAVDAHACRAPRRDDAAFFQLMGPGKRWMDYRAEDSETLCAVREVVEALLALPDDVADSARAAQRNSKLRLPSRAGLQMLHERLDGSLPLRLLLEQIGTRVGGPHHLLNPNYLAKCEGNHGDWLTRMDATRPAKTMVSHMGKDTYAFVHPWAPRTISVREAARIQSFPDWFAFGDAALTDAYKMIGNAVPPMLGHLIAGAVAHVLHRRESAGVVRTLRA